MRLSIIVPVYNVEVYIEECLESLYKQTLSDYEIIIVNDGSIDKSVEIIQDNINDKVKIINKENGGLSSARNVGLKYAKGKYIAFVDSDDFIAISDAYEKMVESAEKNNSDIVVGNAITYYSDNNKKVFPRSEELYKKELWKSDEFLYEALKENSMYMATWLNIYRRDFLIENNLFFKEGILHEDENLTPKIFLNAKYISILALDFYMYRQRENSITTGKNKIKNTKDIIDTCDELNTIYKNIKIPKLRKQFLDYNVMLYLYGYFMSYPQINTENSINKRFILTNSYKIRTKVKAVICNFNPKLYNYIRNKRDENTNE